MGVWIAIGTFARLRNGEVTRWLFRVWAAVSALAARMNGFLTGPVADFRRRVTDAGLTLFPDVPLIARDAP